VLRKDPGAGVDSYSLHNPGHKKVQTLCRPRLQPARLLAPKQNLTFSYLSPNGYSFPNEAGAVSGLAFSFMHYQLSSLENFGLEICETLTKSALSLLLMMNQPYNTYGN
jgi:hypothetical protein